MNAIMLDGVSFTRVRRTAETFDLKPAGPRCGDRGVASSGFHHPGCAKEQCPKCAQQLFCCACEKSDEA